MYIAHKLKLIFFCPTFHLNKTKILTNYYIFLLDNLQTLFFVSVVESPESVKLRINVNFDTKSMSVDCMAIGGQPAPIDFQWRLDGAILNRTSIRREEFDEIGRKIYFDTLTNIESFGRKEVVVNCQVFHEAGKVQKAETNINFQ